MAHKTETGHGTSLLFSEVKFSAPGPTPPRKILYSSGSIKTCFATSSYGPRKHPLAPLQSDELQIAGRIFILVTQGSSMIPAA